MKKVWCVVFFAMLLLPITLSCYSADMESCIIHKNSNFENQKVGEIPSAFEYILWRSDIETEEKWINASRSNTEIVKIEKDGNIENLAVKLNAFVEDESFNEIFNAPYLKVGARCLFNYYPIKDKGVISFSFRVADIESEKTIRILRNVKETRNLDYLDSNSYIDFIKIKGDTVYYRNTNTPIKSGIEKEKWYNVDFFVDLTTKKGTLYFDDDIHKNLPIDNNTDNICEVRFEHPTTEGSAWYIDELKVYEADEMISDAEIDAAWNKYKNSPFYLGYEFENGRAANYNYMAFLKADGKRFTTIGTDRLYNKDSITKLSGKIYKKDEKIMVPADIAKVFDAQVNSSADGDTVSVAYQGKTLNISSLEMVNGVAFMQLDELFAFLGKEYYTEDDILWLDAPKNFDWSLPLTLSGASVKSADRWTLSFSIYERMLSALLFDRPTNAQLDEAIKKYAPNNSDLRVQFTNESLAKIKSEMKNDSQLASVITALIKEGENELNDPYVPKYGDDGKRATYTTGTYNSLTALATAYLFSESEEDRKLFKDAIWNTMETLNTFPDFHSKYNNGLGTGTMSYGLAYAYDWVDWTDEERTLIEDMCKRNIFDYALQNYNTSMTNHGRSIGFNRGNMSPIINGAYASLAISMFESDPEYFGTVIRGALHGMSAGYLTFFPRGEWEEGLSYWTYVCTYFPVGLKSLQNAIGTDFGCTDVPGVLETYKFPILLRGSKYAYSFGDDGNDTQAITAVFMFCANQTDNKEIAQFRKDKMGSNGNLIDVANWVFDTDDYNLGLNSLEKDTYAENASTIVMRTGWDSLDTSVAFHGGANDDNHGHFDTGAFHFDMNGVRFATDLAREDYNLRASGFYEPLEAEKYYPNGYSFEEWHYYRQKGEGHNIVVANRSVANTITPTDDITKAASADMKPTGSAEFMAMEFGETSSYAQLDLTGTNDIFESAVRTVKLDKINNVIEVQDDIKASEKTDFMWSMHTQAEIEISEDGKMAFLTQNNQKIKAKISNDCSYRFEELPAAFDETYGTVNKPLIETPNTVYTKEDEHYLLYGYECDISKDYRKLAVHIGDEVGEKTDVFKLSVTFEPYIEEYQVLSLGEDKMSTVINVPQAGTYTVVFADFERNVLANIDVVTVTVKESEIGQNTVNMENKDFTLGIGDKIMLWNNLSQLKPMCRKLVLE